MDYSRIEKTVDVEKMQQSNITMVGGAVGLTYDLVRCGLGSATLVDFDRVGHSNPARQDFHSTDVGQSKVEVVATNLKRINPEIEVECLTRDYCEMPRDEHDMLFGHTDLFIFSTDFFPAQARGNREAVRLGKPAIWIGLYQGGRAGEIVFYVPGVTEACYRCICSSRYQAFSRGGANISSEGGTILDLHIVDGIAGEICVGILTRGAENRMGRLIDKLGNRNLLQTKIDPDYRMAGKDIFCEYLGNHPANFSFTTIALPMKCDAECPDCRSLHNAESDNVSGNQNTNYTEGVAGWPGSGLMPEA